MSKKTRMWTAFYFCWMALILAVISDFTPGLNDYFVSSVVSGVLGLLIFPEIFQPWDKQ